MKFIWNIEANYVLGRTPHEIDVDPAEFETCDDLHEVKLMLNEIAQEDFEQKVTFAIENAGRVAEEFFNASRSET